VPIAATERLGVEIDGGRCRLTLQRPHAMNALDEALQADLGDAIAAFEADPELRVAVLTGAGGRAFSAGLDLKEVARNDAAGIDLMRPRSASGMAELARCTKPVIAAVDGWCVAAGFELALLCDIRVATRQSRFGLPEPRRSLLGGPGLHLLARAVPVGEAMLMQLTGSPLDAERAHSIGLVQRLVDDREALLAEADAIAAEIVQCAPLAVQAIKRLVRAGRDQPLSTSNVLGEALTATVEGTLDRAEGPLAFAEGRPPRWQGR
jgi:enoyl-CoA hydratase/carnithine racemase